MQEVKFLLKKHVLTGLSQDWRNIVKEIQSDLRFAYSPLLKAHSPAQLILYHVLDLICANKVKDALSQQQDNIIPPVNKLPTLPS